MGEPPQFAVAAVGWWYSRAWCTAPTGDCCTGCCSCCSNGDIFVGELLPEPAGPTTMLLVALLLPPDGLAEMAIAVLPTPLPPPDFGGLDRRAASVMSCVEAEEELAESLPTPLTPLPVLGPPPTSKLLAATTLGTCPANGFRLGELFIPPLLLLPPETLSPPMPGVVLLPVPAISLSSRVVFDMPLPPDEDEEAATAAEADTLADFSSELESRASSEGVPPPPITTVAPESAAAAGEIAVNCGCSLFCGDVCC